MLFICHNEIGLRCNRAVDELVVVRIGGDDTKLEG